MIRNNYMSSEGLDAPAAHGWQLGPRLLDVVARRREQPPRRPRALDAPPERPTAAPPLQEVVRARHLRRQLHLIPIIQLLQLLVRRVGPVPPRHGQRAERGPGAHLARGRALRDDVVGVRGVVRRDRAELED